MPSLLIRTIDESLRDQLKERARAHHRSLEEEARETLRTAIAHDASQRGTERLMQIARRLFGPEHGVELELPPRAADSRRAPIDFTHADHDP
jgi:plasmid stability protein